MIKIDSDTSIESSNIKTYPFRRFCARFIDISIFFLPFFLLILWIDPSIFFSISNSFLIIQFIMVFYFLLEAFLLCALGRTFGRLVFKITILNPNGKKISFLAALKRGFQVWIYGYALGLPLICLFTLWNAYRKLKRKKITSWDDSKFTVKHDNINLIRKSAGYALFISFLFLSLFIPIFICLSSTSFGNFFGNFIDPH